MNRIAKVGLEPDLTLFLNLEAQDGLSRKSAGDLDRLESEGIDFHNRVREGYLAIARGSPQRMEVIDARGSIHDVHLRIRECIDQRLAVYNARGQI